MMNNSSQKEHLRTMRRIIPLFLITFLSFGCKSNRSNVEFADSEKTPLGLYYGMTDWYDQKVIYHDSVFDNIPGIRHQEYYNDLCVPEDSVLYRNCLGIYIDEEYPTKEIRENVFAFTDSIICNALSYHIDEDRLTHDLSQLETVEDFLNIWKPLYDHTGNVEFETPHLSEIKGIRVCVVSHKVATKNNYATYLMESSVDYHGSSGCPSEADYVTYDISSGNPLSIQEVLALYPVSDLEQKIRDAYVKAAEAVGFEPSDIMTGEKLLQEADGAAIINEGLLIYYRPYKIGCGAEGQYNLVLDL